MAEKRFVKLLLLMMLFELLIFPADVASLRRRRRRPVCSSQKPAGARWVNNWQGSFSFQCSAGKSVQLWKSIHRNCKQDRIHSFNCKYGPVRYKSCDCTWQNYANSYDKPLVFKCPNNGFITGIRSFYSTSYQDRKFRFRCCHIKKYRPNKCKITSLRNFWDRNLNYRVPHNYYLVGAFSDHDNRYQDRRWQFEICQFGRCR
ncbi:hemagglutinin/amebocyte aggregation factor-like [Stylophora pistillata]|uniref:Hemagglutinin/amebocyte aggregation factor n=1 Tax=Stylophora pistillata TaxID=50429 RepID=A0A2B4RFR1_STYPI|nr:hemagglutinin/amebocyte aggregation factor-like [Stylophora pistillata]PFX15639.1 Hemagglutinin/amebocyte aggregation factor [Stylophora pistillata]